MNKYVDGLRVRKPSLGNQLYEVFKAPTREEFEESTCSHTDIDVVDGYEYCFDCGIRIKRSK